MRLILFLLVELSCFSLWGQQADTTNLFSTENSLRYAKHLQRTGKMAEAGFEFERILFQQPENDSLRIELSRHYRMMKLYDRAQSTLLSRKKATNFNLAYSQEYARVLLEGENHALLSGFLDSAAHISNQRKDFYRLNSLLFQGKLRSARSLYFSSESELQTVYPTYNNLLNEKQFEKHRSPFLAGFISTLVPGTGKVYAGRWKDGLFSLVAIGGLAFQSYRGFSQNGIDHPYGWIFGGIGFLFYTGNIYGSIKAAQQFNQKIKEKLKIRALAAYSDY